MRRASGDKLKRRGPGRSTPPDITGRAGDDASLARRFAARRVVMAGASATVRPIVALGKNGSVRTRRLVSAKYALASAGASVGTPSSPTPPMLIARLEAAGF